MRDYVTSDPLPASDIGICFKPEKIPGYRYLIGSLVEMRKSLAADIDNMLPDKHSNMTDG